MIVDAVAGRGPSKLIVTMPPQHGKSMLISKYTPAWHLGMFPEKTVILVSYEADYAGSWGEEARNVLAEHGEALYGVRVRGDSKSKKDWRLAGRAGRMMAAGAQAGITGKPASGLLIVDDPVKGVEDAMSELLREKVWNTWLSSIKTRVHPQTVRIVVMTRWHEDDLAGRLLREEQGWSLLRLPALAEADDPLGRLPGEALWPQERPVEFLMDMKSSDYWFSAMYQGAPMPGDGGLFQRKWFEHYHREGDLVTLIHKDGQRETVGLGHCRWFQVIDLAVSEKTTADFTVLGTFAVTANGDLIVIDIERQRIAGPDQANLVRSRYAAEPRVEWIGIEQIGYQLSLIQTLTRDGLPVRPLYPDKDKVARASTAAVRYSLGKVWHPEHAVWRDELEHELLVFPVGTHDDQVDVIAYACRAQTDFGGPVRRVDTDDLGRPRPITAGFAAADV